MSPQAPAYCRLPVLRGARRWGRPAESYREMGKAAPDACKAGARYHAARALGAALLCPSSLRHPEALPVLSWGPTSLSFDWGISPFLLREQLVTPCLRNWWRSQLDLVEKKASHF